MTIAEVLQVGIAKEKGEKQGHNASGGGEDFSLILERFSRTFEDGINGLHNNNFLKEHINHSTAIVIASEVFPSDKGIVSTMKHYEERGGFISPDSRGVCIGRADTASGGSVPDIISDMKEPRENTFYSGPEAKGSGRIGVRRETDEGIVHDSGRRKDSSSVGVSGEIKQVSGETGEKGSGSARIRGRDLTGREISLRGVNAKAHPAGQFQLKEDEITVASGGGKARGLRPVGARASSEGSERSLEESSYKRYSSSLLLKRFPLIEKGEGVIGGFQRVNNKNNNERMKLFDKDDNRGKVHEYLKGERTAGYSRAGRISRSNDVRAGFLKQNGSGDGSITGLRNQSLPQESQVQNRVSDLFSELYSGRSSGNGLQGEIGNTLWKYESISHIVQSKTDYQLLKNADWNFNDVIRQFTLLLNKGGGEARIVLQPESLGTMRLRIKVENNEVSTSIVVENQVVRDLIASKLSVLESSLEEHGFFLGSFEVGVRDDEHEGKALPEEARRGLGMVEKVEKPLRASSSELNGTVPYLPWLSAFVNIMV